MIIILCTNAMSCIRLYRQHVISAYFYSSMISVFSIVDSKPRMAHLMRMKSSKGEKVEIIKTYSKQFCPVPKWSSDLKF